MAIEIQDGVACSDISMSKINTITLSMTDEEFTAVTISLKIDFYG